MPPIVQNQMAPTLRNDLLRERLLPLGPDAVTPWGIDGLKLPNQVAVTPQSISDYLAGRWTQLDGLTNPPLIKVESADIPAFIPGDPAFQTPPRLSTEEKEIWKDWSGDVQLRIQSGTLSVEELDQGITDLIQQARQDGRLAPQSSSTAGMADPTDLLLNQLMVQSNIERDKRKKELQLAAASGNPQIFNEVLNRGIVERMTRVVSALAQQQAAKVKEFDQISQQLGVGTPTSAQVAQSNVAFGKVQTDTSQISMQLQYAMSQLQTVTEDVAGTTRQLQEADQAKLANFRS